MNRSRAREFAVFTCAAALLLFGGVLPRKPANQGHERVAAPKETWKFCQPFLVQSFRSATSPEGSTQGSEGGSWTACTHIRQYGLNTAPMLMRFLAYGIRPAAALEIGCGLGTTADFISRFTPGGAIVTCIEPEPMLAEVFGRRKPPHVPQQLALNLFDGQSNTSRCKAELSSKNFDLVYSLEVAEHIDPSARQDFVKLIADATKGILVFSAARPGQGGTGHLDESMLWKQDWIELFESAGLVLMEETSRFLSKLSWPERAADISPNVIVMRAKAAVHITPQVLVNQGGNALDRSLVFGAEKADAIQAPVWTRTSVAEGQYMKAILQAKASQHIYESALWPELAALAASPVGNC